MYLVKKQSNRQLIIKNEVAEVKKNIIRCQAFSNLRSISFFELDSILSYVLNYFFVKLKKIIKQNNILQSFEPISQKISHLIIRI